MKFFNTINLKKIKLCKAYFVIRYNDYYVLKKTENSIEFFSFEISEEAAFSEILEKKLTKFGNYKLKPFVYFNDDLDKTSALFFLELDEIQDYQLKKFVFLKKMPIYYDFKYPLFYKHILNKISSMEKKYFIYIVRCNDGSLYTGITTNFKRRIEEHSNGKGAKYTKNKGPFLLESLFLIKGRSEASKVEAYIKKLNKIQKEKLLINSAMLLKEFPNLEILESPT